MATPTESHYVRQAKDFLKKFGFRITITKVGRDVWPWADRKKGEAAEPQDHYRIAVTKAGRKPLTYDYWNSLNNTRLGVPANEYDVLSVISGSVYDSADPDELAAELGITRPSQAYAAAEENRKVQAFFAEEAERAALAEIQ